MSFTNLLFFITQRRRSWIVLAQVFVGSSFRNVFLMEFCYCKHTLPNFLKFLVNPFLASLPRFLAHFIFKTNSFMTSKWVSYLKEVFFPIISEICALASLFAFFSLPSFETVSYLSLSWQPFCIFLIHGLHQTPPLMKIKFVDFFLFIFHFCIKSRRSRKLQFHTVPF